MHWQGWTTLAVVVGIFILLALTQLGTDLILCGGLLVLMALQIVPMKDALGGFSNEGVVTVAILFIVAQAVRETGAIAMFIEPLLGRPKTVRGAQARFMFPVAFLSAFVNNTPLVAMMMPVASDWAKKLNMSVSKFMIPLSYAAILGGVCTMIGTSTNLVVNGMIEHQLHIKPLSLFAIAPVGVPCALVGILYVIATAKWLLPDRKPAVSRLDDPREYTIEMVVQDGGPLVGQTIEKAGLRHLQGVYLVEIERGGTIIVAVGPNERLQADDRLIFAGVVTSVVDLQRIRGLAPATDQVFKLDSRRSERTLIEAVVSNTCPLVGKTIRDGRFRHVYEAAVIAVARHGKRIQKKIGDIVLQSGDTLLLEAHPSFVERHRNTRDFFLISSVEDSAPPRHERAYLSLAILLGMVVLASIDKLGLGMLGASMIAAALLIGTRCISGAGARRSIDWEMLVAIAASFGIGRALESSGAAEAIASRILTIGGSHPWGALAAIYAITVVATELITNNAAAVLVFPIGVATAARLGVSPMPFIVAVMIGASLGVATPIGYQTNLMVYGPGGYRFSDYLRIGVPLDIIMGVVAVAILPFVFPF